MPQDDREELALPSSGSPPVELEGTRMGRLAVHGGEGGNLSFVGEGLCRLFIIITPLLTPFVISSGPLLPALTDKETGDTPPVSWPT